MAPESEKHVSIRMGSVDDLETLRSPWQVLYAHQIEHGLLVRLPGDAFEKWVASLRGVLGRFACLFIAESGDEPTGFLTGRIRSLPSYYGGDPVGYVSDVYVIPGARGSGTGRQLLTAASHWFHERGIRRMELQVIPGNEQAREFYTALGWKEELLQMVYTIE